ncbi:uncharacterized protein TNCV_2363231 [Trichonephila clavipes]|nr:uncharacterized protein TNCV_2363231 [Trichonephila clavipes]
MRFCPHDPCPSHLESNDLQQEVEAGLRQLNTSLSYSKFTCGRKVTTADNREHWDIKSPKNRESQTRLVGEARKNSYEGYVYSGMKRANKSQLIGSKGNDIPDFVMYGVLPNSTFKLRGVTVAIMRMTNHHRILGRKPRLVGGVLESFFKNDEGHNVTVNGDRYRAIITNFFIPELNNPDVQELWFQQDGATCHTARATIDLLKDTFGDRLISRFGPVDWPPRSCDLTPLVYFLWGYVKSVVYADKPQTLDHLKDNIRCVIADIRPQRLEKVIEYWTSRLDYIRASRGSHMPEIIFKM